MRGIHRRPVNSPHKGPVTRKMIPFDDVIMICLPRGEGFHLSGTSLYWKYNETFAFIITIRQNTGKDSSPLSATYMRRWTWSPLVACSVACSAPSHYPNQYCLIANWIPWNKFQWSSNLNKIHLKVSSAKMAVILSRGGGGGGDDEF